MKLLTTLLFLAIGMFSATGRAESREDADLNTLRSRYDNWVLGGGAEAYANDLGKQRLKQASREASKAMEKLSAMQLDAPGLELYDTVQTGADEKEVRFLITSALPSLSIAYHLPSSDDVKNPWFHDPAVKEILMEVFDRLHRRGFRHPMHLPWKPQRVTRQDPEQAIVVDFILRTSGYALATFLMRDELRASGRLDRALATCWEIESHTEKTGDLRAPSLQADGVRVVLNLSLPAALAEGNAARLRLLREQLRRSMLPESNAFDTIKPDGLGHHHLAAYLGGYASHTMAQAAFAAWLLRDTEFACPPNTVANVARGLEILRVVSNKYDMHKALGGRFPSARAIPDVLLGYTCLSDLRHPRQREFQRMFARLADEDFMASPLAGKALSGQRDEVPPGPGATAHFLRTLAVARKVGAEPDPQGHWSLNYGPLAVHRRANWMASIKGYSRYWWAFERSIVDARKDPRQENVFGFHDGSGSLMIFGQGKPWVNATDSGYAREGWDWCRMPGTTVRHFTAAQFLEIDKQGAAYNRPYADATFVGGLTFEERQGMFVIDYTEAAPDEREQPLRALKSAFFFDDQIVMLGSGIRDGDGRHAVGTALFQTALTEANTPTFAQGERLIGLDDQERVFAGGAAQLVDAAGNGYFIPAGQRTALTRREQVSMDATASRETRGNFATAWLDHGVSPQDEGYEYVVLVRSGAQALAGFAAHAGEEYEVRRKDAVAHIVRQHGLGITGYAIAKARTDVGDSLIRETSAPCLVMTRPLAGGGLSCGVCNPDLGWEKGHQYAARGKTTGKPPMKPVPTPVTLTLRGAWRVPDAASGITARANGKETLLTIPCEDARSCGFELQPQNP